MNQPDNDLVFSIVLILLFAALGCFLITLTRNHYDTRVAQIKMFLAALAVRFAAAVVVYEFGLVQILGDEDSSGWYGGVTLMKEWGQNNVGLFELPGVLFEAFAGRHVGYKYLLGLLFYVTDAPARMPAAALNCFFGALTVVFAYRIAHSLFTPWVATRVGWLNCFFPSLIIWSAQTVKEPVVILLETIALYSCVHLKKSGFSARYILLCAAAMMLLLPFRFYAAYLTALAAMTALILPQLSKRKLSIHSAVAVAIVVIPLAVWSGMLAQSEAEIERFDTRRIQNFRRDVAYGAGSGHKTQYDMNTSSGFALGTAVGAAHLLLAPFPWQLGGASIRMLLTLPEVLVWWWLFFVGLAPGVWQAIRTRFDEVLPLLLFICGMGLLYSMMFGNVGLIVRQRSQLLPWLLIFAVVGLQSRAVKKLFKRRGHVSNTVIASPRQATILPQG
jgi:4-amino-4-deoxy-L-arabinose transferase-like glycosyltransferase